MSGKRGQRSNARTTKAAAEVPTVEKIVELLRASAPGAQELDDKLKRVFRLSEAQASLRLK
jgi:type II secretory pathway component PulM